MSIAVAESTQVDLDAFVATEYPKVVAAVGLITGNRQDAADAVQDALVGFLAKPPARPIQNLAAWITVVASNRARDLQRSRAAESRALEKVGVTDESVDAELAGLDIDVQAALMALPPQQKEVCVLHYLLDHSVEQIAEGLGVSMGTVKTQLHRARKALAARLGPDRGEEEHDG
ncbi:RNA polymerase sigma factor [Protaetiibacter mangrovi]|uniref:RNA polymerase sigma factor n=1 Tax=Protaetiibacter mangrovi TaxID=2970926 RepID=A0ABT1ZD17_9MICO|nr:RNA polymerase sigma factor [Protaetiibacter mangrovi]MCS0498593.1 RNA polymerase sigma factor [Protaetiibacter mangrovi]TPX03154.1 RNA polymerase sigma factor [Schumannella luteola]